MEDYREIFARRHGLTVDGAGLYREQDMRFDVDFDMPEDAFIQWDSYVRDHGYVSFLNWTGMNNGYTPVVGDSEGTDTMREEFDMIGRRLERALDELFGSLDEGSSDDEDTEEE